MHKDIFSFIKKNTCATVSCVEEQSKPYCFTVFYAWDEKNNTLVFKSSPETRHSQILLQNNFVAGAILPDKLNKLLVQGLQFEGELLNNENPLAKEAFLLYHKRHPLAIIKPGELWVIQINHIKMTDSTKGFGTKIRWERNQDG